MLLSELYTKISGHLFLNGSERVELERMFPDPNELTVNSTEYWTGNDVCDHFGRERRGNRTEIDRMVYQYKKANERVPYNQLDGE